jgi:hypothetical protein
LRVEEHVLEAEGRQRAGKDLLREEQVHSGVVEHVLEAGGCRRAGEELRRQEFTFLFSFWCFWLVPEFPADWLIFKTNFGAKLKIDAINPKASQKKAEEAEKAWEGVSNTCFSELNNVTVDAFCVCLVLHVGRNFLSISSRQKSSEKWKTDDFFILKPQQKFLPDSTLSTYPHKL